MDQCREAEFECSDGTCLSVDSVCNGHTDCGSGDDEYNCGKFLASFFFLFVNRYSSGSRRGKMAAECGSLYFMLLFPPLRSFWIRY